MAVCPECGAKFTQRGPWQVDCKRCLAAAKRAEIEELASMVDEIEQEADYWSRRAFATESRATLEPKILRRPLMLTLPDRHGASASAHKERFISSNCERGPANHENTHH